MSEYQYYEFVAIDAPLSPTALKWVRGLSTRAEVTSTSFVNEYRWGDFKGNCDEMLVRGFDAHVYVSNFGVCRFLVKLPGRPIDTKASRAYGATDVGANITKKPKCQLVCFEVNDDDPGDLFDGSGWMGSLVPIREDLINGDYRSLYLAWLANIQLGVIDDEELEPPVPAGLARLSASLESLARFLNIELLLVEVAALASTPAAADAETSALADWVRGLPPADKDAAIVSVLSGESLRTQRVLTKRFKADSGRKRVATGPREQRRTVGAIRLEFERRLLARSKGKAETRRNGA